MERVALVKIPRGITQLSDYKKKIRENIAKTSRIVNPSLMTISKALPCRVKPAELPGIQLKCLKFYRKLALRFWYHDF
jgi:hypothetical protein